MVFEGLRVEMSLCYCSFSLSAPHIWHMQCKRPFKWGHRWLDCVLIHAIYVRVRILSLYIGWELFGGYSYYFWIFVCVKWLVFGLQFIDITHRAFCLDFFFFVKSTHRIWLEIYHKIFLFALRFVFKMITERKKSMFEYFIHIVVEKINKTIPKYNWIWCEKKKIIVWQSYPS